MAAKPVWLLNVVVVFIFKQNENIKQRSCYDDDDDDDDAQNHKTKLATKSIFMKKNRL